MFGTAGASPDLLSEGVPFFGRLGEVAYDPDEDRVQCHLCGEWFRHISSPHLHRTHGWTSAQYRDGFQLPLRVPLCAPSVSSAHRLSAQARIGRNRFGLGGPSRGGTRQERVRPWQSLAARSPQLVEELHPAANPGLDPAKVAWAANRRVSWRCSTCGHEWVAVISSRTAGSGCPQCARRKGAAAASATKRQVARSRSLAVLRPDLLDLWDPSLNGDIDPLTIAARSSQHVWWRCPACARAWRASVNNRARATHLLCPTCARRRGAAATVRTGAASASFDHTTSTPGHARVNAQWTGPPCVQPAAARGAGRTRGRSRPVGG